MLEISHITIFINRIAYLVIDELRNVPSRNHLEAGSFFDVFYQFSHTFSTITFRSTLHVLLGVYMLQIVRSDLFNAIRCQSFLSRSLHQGKEVVTTQRRCCNVQLRTIASIELVACSAEEHVRQVFKLTVGIRHVPCTGSILKHENITRL